MEKTNPFAERQGDQVMNKAFPSSHLYDDDLDDVLKVAFPLPLTERTQDAADERVQGACPREEEAFPEEFPLCLCLLSVSEQLS